MPIAVGYGEAEKLGDLGQAVGWATGFFGFGYAVHLDEMVYSLGLSVEGSAGAEEDVGDHGAPRVDIGGVI